jgi:uncharacterized membrane protein
LIVVAFRDRYRASEVLNELRRRNWSWVTDLDHGVVVRWDKQAKVRVQLSVDPATKDDAAWARVWSSFLNLSLFLPVTRGIPDAVVELVTASGAGSEEDTRLISDARWWWTENVGLPKEFIRDVGAIVQPGDSALFTLLLTDKPITALKQLRNYGGTVLHSSLGPEQDKKLRAVLAEKSAVQ